MLRFETDSGPVEIRPSRALVAGWTGRDRAAVEHHIEELAALGVARPSAVPLYYRVSRQLLTQETTIEVLGPSTSGEAEPVLVDDGARLWLTLGSDHTDRELEARSVALSKQACAKPLADRAWAFDSLADRIDAIEMRSWIRDDEAGWTDYQQGTLSAIRALRDLVRAAPGATGDRLGGGTVMMCGTLPVLRGGIRPARHMRLEMRDPARATTSISLEYAVHALPVVR